MLDKHIQVLTQFQMYMAASINEKRRDLNEIELQTVLNTDCHWMLNWIASK